MSQGPGLELCWTLLGVPGNVRMALARRIAEAQKKEASEFVSFPQGSPQLVPDSAEPLGLQGCLG